jgi:hypothetical protein
MNRALLSLVLLALCGLHSAFAKEGESYPADFGPDDAIAAIDGQPILVGELNLLLRPMAKGESVASLPIKVHQAAAIVLVRRRVAMKQLIEKGGEPLASAMDRHVADRTNQLQRKGSSVDEFSDSEESNASSLTRSWSWDAAWNLYLKTRLTDANLRKFYEQKRGPTDPLFKDLTDLRAVRRQASDALFSKLVASQQSPDVQWFIPALKPPTELTLVP